MKPPSHLSPDLPYPRRVQVLHWLTVAALISAAAFILTRDELSSRAWRGWLMEGHRHAGLIVLLLFVARLLVRLGLPRRPHDAGTAWSLRMAAAATHVVLYAMLLGMPLLGWALSSAQGNPVHFFGLTLPPLIGEDEDLADTLQTWHMNAAWVLLGVICLHIGAALWHHFVLRDGVLRRMTRRARP
jgi:cytochrome b561